MASLHSGRQWGTGRGPLESLHSTGFFDFCQPTLQVFWKVTYYLCGCENTLCSSRVCEITWNSIESCSGKAIAVGISYVTKPHPGLNDIIYIRLHSSTPEAICRAPNSPCSISAWPSLAWGWKGLLLSISVFEPISHRKKMSLILKWINSLGFLDVLHKPRRLWIKRQKKESSLPSHAFKWASLWKEET